MPTIIEEDWMEEADFATALGINRDILKKARRDGSLELSGDVGQGADGSIIWKKSAASAFAATLGLSFQTPVPDALAASAEPETVTVVRRAANRNIVMCARAGGEMVAVRVIDNKKYFQVGLDGKPMSFQARKNDSGTWWNLVGREPRWPGKF